MAEESLTDVIKCPKCFSHQVTRFWIEDQKILHCQCVICTYEWVE